MASNNAIPTINTTTDGAGDVNSLNVNSSASGNLSFEVVLSPARAMASPSSRRFMQSPAVVASPRSMDDIAAKMKTAEDNRERFIDEKVEKIKEHDKRVEEIRKISAEMQEVEAQRNLEKQKSKLAKAEELRQQHLESLVEKLKEHDNHIEQVRNNMIVKGESNGEKLQNELDDAMASREMVAEAIQEKQQKQNGTTNGHTKENRVP